MRFKTDELTNNIQFERKHCAQVFGAHRLLLIESSFIWPWCPTVLDFHEFKSPVLHLKFVFYWVVEAGNKKPLFQKKTKKPCGKSNQEPQARK